jgi:hypothetical protein
MPTINELVANHTAVLATVRPGEYTSITSTVGGQSREVMVLSLWDEDLDKDSAALEVKMSDLNDRPAFHFHFARDTATALVLLDRGRRRYLFEPGEDAIDYLCARKKATQEAILAAFRKGDFGHYLTQESLRRRKALRAEVKSHKNMVAWQKLALEQRRQDIADQNLYIGKLEAEIKRLQAECRDEN